MLTSTSRGRCWALLTQSLFLSLMALSPSVGMADEILKVTGTTLTGSAIPASPVQRMAPQRTQRGVLPDGTLLIPWRGALSIAGNPYEGAANAHRFLMGMDLAAGTYSPTEVDLAFPARIPWIIARSYNSSQASDDTSYQGANWMQMSQPELVASGTDRIYLTYAANGFLEFEQVGSTAAYRGVNGTAGTLLKGTTASDPIEYHDQAGNIVYFFGMGDSAVPGQIWKIVGPGGDTAYVGDKDDPVDAKNAGYDGSKRILVAYDSAGRRFSYTYSSGRLTSVVCAGEVSSVWTEIGRVEYAYGYSSAGALSSDLSLVTVKLPSDVTGEVVHTRRHYRYWTGWGGSATHALMQVFGAESCRRLAWNRSGLSTANFENYDFSQAAQTIDEPFVDASFEYETSGTIRRITRAWFNGLSATAAHYDLTYENNPSYSDSASAYDQAWRMRVIVDGPVRFDTRMYDEAGQPLTTILTDVAPTGGGSSVMRWVYPVERDAHGRLVRSGTPASVASYTHSTGTFTWRASDGLVTHLDRVSSGNLAGFVESVRHSKGYDSATPANTAKFYDMTVGYLSSGGTESVGGFTIVNPLLSSVTNFANEGTTGTGGDTTNFVYTFHTGVSKPLAMMTRVTQYPKVSEEHNGRGAETSDPVVESKAYFDVNGDVRFVRSMAESVDPLYRITYVGYAPNTGELDDGQPRLVVEDAKTSVLTGVTVPTGFESMTTEAPFHRPTTYEYDRQGKPTAAVAPGNRRSEMAYLRTADHRLLTVHVPRVKDGLYYTPASVRLYNHSGIIEEWGQVAAATGSSKGIGTTDDPPTEWKGSTGASLKAIFNTYLNTPGSRYLSALSEATLDASGSRVVATRRYFDIYDRYEPIGDYYDSDVTQFGYDDAARLVRVENPAGTITATTFDALDRIVSVSRGTDDSVSTSNMKVVTELSYDDNGSTGYGGNSNTTIFAKHVSASESRTYELLYDYRNRPWAMNSPLSPHYLFKYDNRNRILAVGLYEEPFTATGTPPDPTSLATDRLALRESAFDSRGQRYQETRWEVNATTGAKGEAIVTSRWFDPEGNLLMSRGATIEKYEYNHRCCATSSYVLAAVGIGDELALSSAGYS